MIVAPDFPDHWKTRTLVAMAGDEAAIRCLLRFWAHCQQRRQSVFDKLSPDTLALICNWQGDVEVWWKAMLATFLERKGRKFIAHDWDSINSTLIGRWKGGRHTQEAWSAKAKPPDHDEETEGKAKAEPPVSHGQKAGEKRRVEKSGEDKIRPPTVPQGGQAILPGAVLIGDPDEAKRLICQLILKGKDPERAWSYEAMHGLSELLPIPMSEIKLVAWFHGLEADAAVQELKVRRQSETTLMNFWSDEVTRAEGFRKKRGASLNGSVEKKDPPAWREFYRWYHENPEVMLPGSYWELPESDRQNYDREFVKFAEEKKETT